MKYIRVYADAVGESHFEDVEVQTRRASLTPATGPMDVSKTIPFKGTFFVGIPEVNWTREWNPSPEPLLCIILSGVVEDEVSDGERRLLKAGDIVLFEDTHGKGHTTRILQSATSVFVRLAEQ